MTDVLAGVPTELLIGGEWTPGAAGHRFDVEDPATGKTVTSVASADVADATAAVAAAAAAGPGWAATAPRERGEVLRRTFDAMCERRDHLAALIVLESGKSWGDAVAEVAYAAEFFRWYGEEAVRADGRAVVAPGGDRHILTLQKPVGVAVLVTPWNFPAAMATRKIGPALAAGCTVVLKPASETPLTALLIGQLLLDAGAPAGVVNVVPAQDPASTVGAMLRDPRTRKLSFTGSTAVGRNLLAQASEQVLRCSMELGGNAPFIVYGDADLDAAVEGALVAKMRNGGESCIAANRFLVEASIAPAFTERFTARMAAMTMGPGSDPSNQIGPLITERARDDLHEVVRASLAGGSRATTGGAPPVGPGWFYPPTVLDHVDPDDDLLGHELFGPVAPIVTFEDEASAIALANATEFGLAAYVFSGDLGRALRTGAAIEAGVVGINRGLVSDPAAPFGGTKQSGLGREGGHDGLLEFLETSYLAVSW